MDPIRSQTLSLGGRHEAVAARIDTWSRASAARRLWERDHTLWSPDPQPEIKDRLGWLHLPETMRGAVDDLQAFADEAAAEGIAHVVLLGMGGSSLAPEVFQRTFGNRAGRPELVVLDSTHPGAVRAVSERIDPAATLFLVSSKSGTTIEPLAFFHYFWEQTAAVFPDPGSRFAAITDPGSPLEALAERRGFRRVFRAPPDVGGRYSALTPFGLVPAALIGADLPALLDGAAAMAEASRVEGPAFALGAALGELARRGLDKATFLVSPSLAAFPAWAEQLVAESTGKQGTGILPVADEAAGPPAVYGDDRLFVYLAHPGDDDAAQAARVGALEATGHPVARIAVEDLADLGAEMYRAEVAVAMAGAVLAINPFDQPDVQMAKELAKRAMAGDTDGRPIVGLSMGSPHPAADALAGFLDGARPGDYLALQAFVEPTTSATACLQRIRHRVRDRLRLATTLGFGPGFLHSTGQLHKGGPGTGLFLQIVDRPTLDLPVPETGYSFGRLVSAQADGDFRALRTRGRRVLRLDLGHDAETGLAALDQALEA